MVRILILLHRDLQYSEKWPFTEPHVQKIYLKEKLFSVLSGLMSHNGDKRLNG